MSGDFHRRAAFRPYRRAVKSTARPIHPRWILAAISTALFCVQIDYFAMNLALPRMASDLGSTTTDLQWVISIYMLALGAFMAPAGRIGDIFGRRRTLLAGIAVFGIASVFCATSCS
jgi:MFS family permease